MFGFQTPEQYHQASDLLKDTDYTYEGVCHTLGGVEWITPQAINLPRLQRKIQAPVPHNVFIRLFLLGEDVPLKIVEESLKPMPLELWFQADILKLSSSKDTITSTIRLTPLDDFVLASDTPKLDVSHVPFDFVMPPGGTSIQLGWSAIRRQSRRTLDLGAGCGYLSFVAAAFSDTIIATDRNERASMMVHFNACLNSLDKVEARTGDLFEPVQGEKFDLILCNPPFVITPHQNMLFRDSGVRGDTFCRNIIQEIPAYLNEGGYCHMLANFAHRPNSDWKEELSAWFSGLGCDAFVLITKQQAIDEYAMSWITSTESQDVTIVPQMFTHWMDYYEAEGIDKISYLSINLRKRKCENNWTYLDEEPVLIAGECGDILEKRFALQDFLLSLTTEKDLLNTKLVLASEVKLIQSHTMTENGPKVCDNTLETTSGLRQSAHLDVHVLRLLTYCDGTRTLTALMHMLSEAVGITFDHAVKIGLPVIRLLINRGYLHPGES